MSEQSENNFKGMGNEMAKAIHASKSYTTQAIITLILYYVGFYIVGLIMNLVYLSSANQSKRISGVSPSGRGCLLFLLWTHLFIPLIIILGLLGIISLLSYDFEQACNSDYSNLSVCVASNL